jgi:hypothetical protein
MSLHDAWIAAYEGAGPQPDAPYALANGRTEGTGTVAAGTGSAAGSLR